MSTIITIQDTDLIRDSNENINTNFTTLNTDKGDASTSASVSVDSEIALFSSTTGKLLKRMTGSGIVKATSGVASVVTAPSGTIVGDTDTQTLTNKTLTSPVINVGSDATGDIYYRNAGVLTRLPIGTNTHILTVTAGLPVWAAPSGSSTFADNAFTLQDNGDTSKQLMFQLSGITASTTRTLTVPDADTTVVGTDATQTLSNKTLTAPKFADLGFIADANGNELIILDTVASAVNEIIVANAATTANPTITASGETNVGLTITGKGTKGVSMGNALDEKVVTLTDAATISVDASLGNIFTVTLGGNRTLGNPTNAVNGQKMIFRIRQDGTGTRTLALDTKFRFGTDITSFTATVTADKTDYLGVIYHSGDDKFDVIATSKGY